VEAPMNKGYLANSIFQTRQELCRSKAMRSSNTPHLRKILYLLIHKSKIGL